MIGEDVVVMRPARAYDEDKDPVDVWEEEPVSNVLFGRPSTEALTQAAHVYGVEASYELGVPKAYQESLRGCLVRRERDGAVYAVLGDPQPLPPELCPTSWNRSAVVRRFDG